MSTFVDEAQIEVAAGRGGRGASSFRREKYVPLGGPDGGDGGRGGDVILVASDQESTLFAFRRQRSFSAQNGGDGSGGKRAGKQGDDCVIPVPPGTVVKVDGEVIADLDRAGAKITVARGGRGGHGNVRFASSVQQAPRHAELGDPGTACHLNLELKLIADIGLVGLPNAGKSTLLATWTRANPKIGAYPFTTLSPNLGVADIGDLQSVVIADVPGLIEGAHEGAGLGIEFLRHIERTRVLVHVVDAAEGVQAASQALATIRQELTAFSPEVGQRSTLLVLNKIDLPEGEQAAAELVLKFKPSCAISAMTGDGCEDALAMAAQMVAEARASVKAAPVPAVISHRTYGFDADDAAPVIRKELDGGFRVHAPAVEKRVARTDTQNEESMVRLSRIFRKSGIDDALRAAGCGDGDTVYIGNVEFIFVDEHKGHD